MGDLTLDFFTWDTSYQLFIMSRLALIVVLASAIAAISLAEPVSAAEHHVMRNKLQESTDEPIKDCETCAEDIIKAVEDCSDVPPDDEHALLKCIEDCLITTADCIECICEVMGELIGIDIEPCHPGQE